MLRGRVTVTPDGGEPVEVKAGDLVTFPAGGSRARRPCSCGRCLAALRRWSGVRAGGRAGAERMVVDAEAWRLLPGSAAAARLPNRPFCAIRLTPCAGMSCTWDVHEAIHKHYNFH